MSYRGNTPSTLSDVLRYVQALYAQPTAAAPAGLLRTNPKDPSTGIEMLTGERYRKQNGAPPRIVFEQLPQAGKIGPVLEIGARESFSVTETCLARVWGRETTAQPDRYDAAKTLAMQLLDGFKLAAPGYLTGASILREDQTNIETFGEEYQLLVSYTWAVPRDEALRQAAVALALFSDTPQDIDRPNGGTGDTFVIDVIPQNTRP